MKKTITTSTLLICLLLIHCHTFAQLGKDGAKIISGTVTNLNEYTTLTADAVSGNTSVSVTNSTLNGGGNFSGPLGPGDMIMIIQMQGATLNNYNDSTWGAVTNYNNCGNYEFAEVLSTPNSNTINLNCGLQKNYSAGGRTQVIRVARYASLTVNSGGVISCPAWNGAMGGVLAIEVSGNTVINSGGKVDVSAKGFRGAQLLENLTSYGIGDFAWLTGDRGAEKGEGIGGYEGDYDIYGGRYCKGAAANGGGGGNAHNAGGGGGGNGGNPAAWSGKGNPDTSNASWISAWNMEYMGFAYSSSSGGGKGGYTFSGNNKNALVDPPNNSAWGGDYRDNNGGLGGRPLDYSGGRIFPGGGGGAGDQNDNVGGVGGAGGGLFYLMNYGTLSGSGQVLANGANGANTGNSGLDGGIDGAGGGGAGGTIILNSSGAISGISTAANGGNGGSQTVTFFDQYEAEGPGAGGGGGYIATSNGAITCTANGGTNGTTNSASLTEFPANGATKGGSGTTNASISNFALSISNVTVCNNTTANLNVTVTGTLPGGTNIYWYDSALGGNVLGSGTFFTTPALTGTVTYYVGSCPGTYRLPVTVTIDSVSTNFTFSTGCLGTSSTFTSASNSTGGTINKWSWDFGDGSGTSSLQNPSYTYFTSGTYPVILAVTDNAGCSANATHMVNVGAGPSVSFSASQMSGCDSLAVQFTNNTTGGQSYRWSFGDGDTSLQQSPLHTYVTPGNYTVVLAASSNGCASSDTIAGMIHIYGTPVANFSLASDCASRSVQLSDSSTGPVTSWTWDFGDGVGTSSQQDPLYVYYAYSTYTITLVVSGGGGCNDTISKPVTFTTPPNVSFSANTVIGCDSVVVTFTNNTTNSVSYHWDFGDGGFSNDTNPVHSYATPGIYNVTLTAISPGGCSIAQSVINMITVNASPAIPSISQNGDTLISSAASTYQWYFNAVAITGATNQTYIATANGDYFVIVTNASACTASSAEMHVILNRISEVDGPSAVFYPNPVKDYLEIILGNSSNSPFKATLTDVLGKVIWEKPFVTASSKQVILDMKKMSKSVYFLTFYYPDKTTVSRIIKE